MKSFLPINQYDNEYDDNNATLQLTMTHEIIELTLDKAMDQWKRDVTLLCYTWKGGKRPN